MADVRTAAVMEALASVYDPCCQEKGLSVVDMGLVGGSTWTATRRGSSCC